MELTSDEEAVFDPRLLLGNMFHHNLIRLAEALSPLHHMGRKLDRCLR